VLLASNVVIVDAIQLGVEEDCVELLLSYDDELGHCLLPGNSAGTYSLIWMVVGLVGLVAISRGAYDG
jgi:hypothetical protein